MNTFNRVVVACLLLIGAMLCCVLLVGGKWVLPALADQLGMWADSLDQVQPYVAAGVGAAIAFVVDLVLILLFILEVRPPRRKFIRAEKAAGGEVQVSIASIAERLKHEVGALPGVLSAKPKVLGRRGGVVVYLEVDMAAGLDVTSQAEQIVETARQVVEERMGLKMARLPKVHVRTVAYPHTAVERRRPSEPEPAPAPAPPPIQVVELPPAPPEEEG
jgi:hypothetical protein